MSAIPEDKQRQVVPRWRAFHSRTSLTELQCALSKRRSPAPLSVEALKQSIERWKASGGVRYAAEVVGNAIVIGRHEEAKEAAEFIVSAGANANPTAERLARRALGLASSVTEEFHDTTRIGEFRNRIHDLRRRTQVEPRNVFLWVDLALAYESLGFRNQAIDAVRPALILAPYNRFVLRSVARLYIHHDDYGQAHSLIANSPGVRADPWLLSAEIASAAAMGRTSKLVKHARTVVSSGDCAPLHVSELASALATLELEAGRAKKAAELYRLSLVVPTENAVAQAEWAQRHVGEIKIEEELVKVRQSSEEALSWSAGRSGRWVVALEASKRWFVDQAFSSRPAVWGSYYAGLGLGEFGESADIAKRGLVANPDNFALLNNFAFAAAQAGDLNGAVEAYRKIGQEVQGKHCHFVWLATGGLLAYRQGQSERGRRLYLGAVREARAANEPVNVTLVLLHFALEEVRAKTDQASSIAKEAMDRAGRHGCPDVLAVLGRLKKEVDTGSHQ